MSLRPLLRGREGVAQTPVEELDIRPVKTERESDATDPTCDDPDRYAQQVAFSAWRKETDDRARR